MTSPRLTVITPSLNQGTFIERTIRSVLDQGYPDLEYIVIDGGSTDGTTEVLRRYDDQLVWVSEPDTGQAHAINKGLGRSSGQIVAFINSDDFYLPGAFSAALRAFESPAVVWVAGACRYERPDGTVETVWRPALPTGRRRVDWLEQIWNVPQPGCFWRREVFETHGAFREDLHYVFDSEFELRLALAGVLPVPIDDIVAVRYLQPDAKSENPEKFRDEFARVRPTLARQLSLGDRGRLLARTSLSRFRRWVWRLRQGIVRT
ncbi:MAG TPA: glycosyltransferase family 2 protein [Gaiellaceae bacterium]|nr:glycosyltransferase family 2 protein [Gaiellaceae bacterium]